MDIFIETDDDRQQQSTVNLIQFFIATIITIVNILLLFITFNEHKLRTTHYYLLANLWFANIVLALTIVISNVIEQVQHN
jgi:hypothetical protein